MGRGGGGFVADRKLRRIGYMTHKILHGEIKFEGGNLLRIVTREGLGLPASKKGESWFDAGLINEGLELL